MAELPGIDFGKGYTYRPTKGIFKNGHLVIADDIFKRTYERVD